MILSSAASASWCKLLPDSFLCPFGQPAANRAVRTSRRSDEFIARTMHHCRENVLEHDPMGNSAAMTSPRVGWRELGLAPEQGLQFSDEGLDKPRWHARRGHSRGSVARTTSLS